MTNKGADQTARMRRLIWAFIVRIWHEHVVIWHDLAHMNESIMVLCWLLIVIANQH